MAPANRREAHGRSDWNIKEAIELYLETLPIGDRNALLSREILSTSVEVNA
jgi:hypothetical protein